jgi:hypothetical protein
LKEDSAYILGLPNAMGLKSKTLAELEVGPSGAKPMLSYLQDVFIGFGVSAVTVLKRLPSYASDMIYCYSSAIVSKPFLPIGCLPLKPSNRNFFLGT